ncbi:RNA methyltransferase [Patescibacteria group bacterium]|nr:RNA methyltransferase [Patescibacteria group bacterium]
MEHEIIISKDNDKIKLLRKLSQKKFRDEFGTFKVENLKIINSALQVGYKFTSIYITQKFIDKNEDFIRSLDDNYQIVSDNVSKSYSDLSTPAGVCAVFKNINQPIDYKTIIVYLNGISDPGNLGTIFRSALAFGIRNIVVDEHCADIYNYKTIQAAKDSIFRINISGDMNRELLIQIKEKMKVYTARSDNAQTIENAKLGIKYCLVLGSEAHGVKQNIIDISDGFIKIEINQESESLNVANAASILFYEMRKKLD